jgi:hypothetical protein
MKKKKGSIPKKKKKPVQKPKTITHNLQRTGRINSHLDSVAII